MKKRKIRVKFIIIFAIIIVVFSFPVLIHAAELNQESDEDYETQTDESEQEEELDYILDRKMTDEEEQEALELTDYYNSMTTFFVEDEPVKSVSAASGLLRATALPAAYDSRNNQVITAVRNQDPYGTCWAFTAINSLEAHAVKKNILELDSADLSELHLVYYTMFPVVDELGGTEGDKTECLIDGTGYLQIGANVQVAYNKLANWGGAVAENTAPYENAGEDLPETVDSAYKQDIIHLQNAYAYSMSDDVESIKQAIIDYGAVGISFYSGTSYYNANTAAYYCPVETGTNHAVSVIGWNDEYSKDNFNSTPENDGAWLVKNSWGENWGDNGYFWLSYEDKSLGSNAYVLLAESADNYDHNYQYDGTVFNDTYDAGINSIKIANLFEARANQDGQEEIAAVSFSTTMVNASYSIQLYIEPEEEDNPESGQAALTVPVTGMIGASGYYTVVLDEKAVVEEGQKFAVVITLENDNRTVEFVSDGDRTISGVIKTTAYAEAGQSFIGINGTWQDFGESYGRNLRIKAFTNDVSGQVPVVTPGETPTAEPSMMPTAEPNMIPTAMPSMAPTVEPSMAPTMTPTATPEETEDGFWFDDVAIIPGNWKYEGIKYVYENHIMNGITNADGTINTFQPDEPLTRAMFATVLYRMAGSPSVRFVQCFTDVAAGRYYSDAIVWAYQNNIVNGYADGSYGVNDYITREQIAKMLKVYADLEGYDTSERMDITSFPDVSEVSGWATEYMRWATGCKMINGKNQNGIYYLDAKGDATRAECAVMLKRFLDKYED